MIAIGLDQERRKLEDVYHPQHAAAVEGLSDYLTIMNLLYKSISRILEGDCSCACCQPRGKPCAAPILPLTCVSA